MKKLHKIQIFAIKLVKESVRVSVCVRERAMERQIEDTNDISAIRNGRLREKERGH